MVMCSLGKAEKEQLTQIGTKNVYLPSPLNAGWHMASAAEQDCTGHDWALACFLHLVNSTTVIEDTFYAHPPPFGVPTPGSYFGRFGNFLVDEWCRNGPR